MSLALSLSVNPNLEQRKRVGEMAAVSAGAIRTLESRVAWAQGLLGSIAFRGWSERIAHATTLASPAETTGNQRRLRAAVEGWLVWVAFVARLSTRLTELHTRRTRNTLVLLPPYTLHPKPYTQNPKPKTQNPKLKTQISKPKTEKPKTENRKPKTETRNPKPKTQNPNPKLGGARHEPSQDGRGARVRPESRFPDPESRDPNPQSRHPNSKAATRNPTEFRFLEPGIRSLDSEPGNGTTGT